jgi:hypothetical protein
MWDNLTPADLDRVRHELALERGALLHRHAAELKELDARYDQFEKLNQLIGRFTEKYLKTGIPLGPGDEGSTTLHGEQQITPNFGNPIRRLVGR